MVQRRCQIGSGLVDAGNDAVAPVSHTQIHAAMVNPNARSAQARLNPKEAVYPEAKYVIRFGFLLRDLGSNQGCHL